MVFANRLFHAAMIIGALVLVMMAMLRQPNEAVMLIGVACIVAVAAIALPALLLEDENPTSPITLLALCVFIAMPARFALIVLVPESWKELWYLKGMKIDDFVVPAFYATAAVLALAVGYALGSLVWRVDTRPMQSRIQVDLGRASVVSLPLVVLAIGVAVIFLQMSGLTEFAINTISKKRAVAVGDNVQAAGLYLTWITNIVPAIGLLLLMGALHQRRRVPLVTWGVVFIALSFTVLWSFATSNRAGMIIFAIVTVSGILIVKRRIPVLLMTGASTAAVALFGLMSVLRGADRTTDLGDVQLLKTGLEALSAAFNLGGFAAMRWVFDVVPSEMPYRYGSTFLGMFWALVPRIIWPEKPLYLGYEWYVAFGGDPNERLGGGAGTSLVGEAVLNFGPLGGLLVLLVFGVFCRFAFAWFSVRIQRSILWATLYLLLLPTLTYLAYGYATAKGGSEAIQTLVAFLIVLVLLRVTGCLRRSPVAQEKPADPAYPAPRIWPGKGGAYGGAPAGPRPSLWRARLDAARLAVDGQRT
jgi:oligosaccharide repeat unit polymerase